MTGNYQVTEADFREAMHCSLQSPVRRRLAASFRLSMILTMLGTVLPYCIAIMATPSMESHQRASWPLAVTLDSYLPLVCGYAMYIGMVLVISGLRTANWRLLLSAALAAGAAVFVFGGSYLSASLAPRRSMGLIPSAWAWAPHLGWIVLTIGVTFFVVRSRRMNLRMQWAGNQHLHMPTSVDASVTGLVLTTPTTRYEYAWAGIPGFHETPKLFLVHISSLMFHIVPKRAFAGAEEQQAFLQMLRNLTTNTGAFPVVQASAPASTVAGEVAAGD